MHKFLLVDDSRVMRQMLKNTISAAGFGSSVFHEAVNGEDAILRLEEVGFDVDIVFCDIHMPTMDGLAFVDSLAKRGKLESCPVIVLTGDIREQRGREAIALGARQLICKPFTPESISKTINKVLDNDHSNDGSPGGDED